MDIFKNKINQYRNKWEPVIKKLINYRIFAMAHNEIEQSIHSVI